MLVLFSYKARAVFGQTSRGSATIDLVHDEADNGSRMAGSTLVLIEFLDRIVTSIPDDRFEYVEVSRLRHCEGLTVTNEKSTPTVMIVEDYDDTRLLLKRGLEGLGYSVLEASNGQEAVDIAEREHPDLILMDLDLPILDGIAATQRIRRQSHMDGVPIVALTAYPLSYSRVKAFAKGCNDYMAKPIDMSELANLVNRYLRAG